MKRFYWTLIILASALACASSHALAQGNVVTVGPTQHQPVGASQIWYYQSGTTGDDPLFPGWHQVTSFGGSSGGGGAISAPLGPTTTPANSVATVVTGPLPAGTNVLGSVTTAPTLSTVSTATGPVTVSTTSAQILPANASRLGASIQNSGTTTMWLSFGGTAVAGQGIYVAPGGQYPITQTLLWRGAVSGIVATGTTTISTNDFQ